MKNYRRKLKKLFFLTAVVCVAIYLINIFLPEEINVNDYTNSSFYRSVFEEYGAPIGELCIGWSYRIYLNFTLFNVALFLIQYVPMTVYMIKTIRNIYKSSRARVKQKRMELKDIENEIEAVKSKLIERDQEFIERSEKLRREAERLKRVRARVREIISADELLRQTFEAGIPGDVDSDLQTLPDEEHEYVMQVLKELHYNQSMLPKQSDDCSDVCHSINSETSIYSSISGDNIKQQDCRVKVVKVTNVYKIAYLKHFIKQKRLRRANKQAILKKKMEGIKKQLENWQKTLNMVINNQLSLFNIDSHPIDVVSQEAMGDYTKPSEYSRAASDSDSDLRDSESDFLYDDYFQRWTHNSPHARPILNAKDASDATLAEFNQNLDNIESDYLSPRVDCTTERHRASDYLPPLTSLPEETRSQLAIAEDDNDSNGRKNDLIKF